MNSARKKSRRSNPLVTAFLVVASLSFITFIMANIFSDEIADVRSHSPDSFSPSAIGHKALRQTLEAMGIETAARRSFGKTPSDSDLLIVAEPDLDGLDYEELDTFRELIEDWPRVLLVLPKRDGYRSYENPLHNRRVRLKHGSEVVECLDAIGSYAGVDRFDSVTDWRFSGERFAEPTVPGDLQLLEVGSDPTPMIECDEGTLVGVISSGEYERGICWVLSDPDVLANHGFHRGDNALLAIQLIEALRGADGRVVFEEVFHGHAITPSLFRSLFRMPLAYATAHGLLILIVVLVAGTVRFGSPLAVAIGYKAGKEALMKNTAALLAFGGHGGFAIRRYLADTTHLVAERLHVSRSLEEIDFDAALDSMKRSEIQIADLREEVAELRSAELGGRRRSRTNRVGSLARKIHRWRREMLDGTR